MARSTSPGTETIKFTAVPNGIAGDGNYKLSVMISPELAGGTTGTLADFADFQDWPGTLAALNGAFWSITLDESATGGGNQTVSVPLDASGTNSDLWQILFPTSTEYGPPSPDQDLFRNIGVVSYPVSQVTGFLTGQYANYSPSEVPTLSTVKGVFGSISDVLVGVTSQERMDRLAAARRARSKGGTLPHANDFSGASMADAFAAQAYYHMPGIATPPPPGLGQIDFHKALTFIGQHGVLQRALGLVFDIEFLSDLNIDISSTPNIVFVSVELVNANGAPVALQGPGYTPISPRTQSDISTSLFQAHSISGQITDGMLTVGDPTSFNAHTIDFDGAGLRASTFATQIQLSQAPATIDERFASSAIALDLATPMPPPMVRSNGLTLTQVGRGQTFADALARVFLLFDAAANNDPVPDLTAEDLVRGYVLDVLDAKDNVWRSTAEWLCQYVATPPSGSSGLTEQTITSPTTPPFSESSTQAPPRVQSSPTDASTMQANVSEVLLRYNGWSNAVPRPGKVIADDDSQVPNSNPDPFTQMTITVSPPAARLAPLRFGHTYQLRARIVDVANNVLPVSTASSSVQETAAMVYGRQEPIGSPDVYSQSILRLAESLKRLVVRDIDGSSAFSLRAFAPQRCQEPFAEWHGMFDTGAGGAIDGSQTTYNVIVPSESGHYPDPPADPMTTAPTPISLTTAVPFLPDPLARGGVLTIQDGTQGGQTVPFSFQPGSAQWPAYMPYGLKLVPGSAPADQPLQTFTVDNTARLITVTLTEADTITVLLNATCNPTDIPLLALATAFTSFDDDEAAAGQYWSITPTVQLELIYAVQKPLLTPEFPAFPTPARNAGDTFATLDAYLTYSPKSTSNIDLLADWGDPVDDPVNKLPIQGPGTPNANLRQTSNSPVVTFPSSSAELASFGTQEYDASDPFSVQHEFFDTKHRNVTYHSVATSQFTEFYEPGTAVTNETAKPVTVNILSSARPDTLDIRYVVPIYAWQQGARKSRAGNVTTSERSPSALRVFINRPWWSSGIDELLGVITWPGAEGSELLIPPGRIVVARDTAKRKRRHLLLGTPPVNAPIPPTEAQYLTDWGADPVFASPALPHLHPQMSSFPNATQYGTGLSIDEKTSFPVNVAGHPVLFDATRNLWYCDVAVDTGATYTPMIRLALARFQPNSIPGVELGRIVLADIMSLEPGRTATIVRRGAGELSSVTLSGFSYSHAANARNVAPGVAELIIESRQTSIKDDTLGWEQVGDAIQMTPRGGPGGTTAWTAHNVKLPKGTLRACINQYEVLPTDRRQATTGFYLLVQPARELRLVHQDLIPL